MKFSIVTPSFRQIEWLRLCVASVRDQAAADSSLIVEHVVQDGGTPEIERFADECDADFYREGEKLRESSCGLLGYRLSIYNEADEGMYDAINRGLRRSSGSICAWLNCDEQYLPDTLQAIAGFFQSHPSAEVVTGDTVLLNDKLHPCAYRKAVAPDRRYLQAFQMNLHSSSLFFSRQIVERGHWLGKKYRSIGDAEWVAGLLDAGISFHILPLPLSTFILGRDNLSAGRNSAEERRMWRAEMKLSALERIFLKARNLLGRLLAGAYLPRRAEVSVFSPDDLVSRTRMPACWMDFRFRA